MDSELTVTSVNSTEQQEQEPMNQTPTAEKLLKAQTNNKEMQMFLCHCLHDHNTELYSVTSAQPHCTQKNLLDEYWPQPVPLRF